jgi:RNA polymerase-binding transcription factor DksA
MTDLLATTQAAIDTVLTPEQQARERMPDGTYRVCCSRCGKSVSSPLPLPVIVRAWVECPECIESKQ